jgi:hypothetical protein
MTWRALSISPYSEAYLEALRIHSENADRAKHEREQAALAAGAGGVPFWDARPAPERLDEEQSEQQWQQHQRGQQQQGQQQWGRSEERSDWQRREGAASDAVGQCRLTPS